MRPQTRDPAVEATLRHWTTDYNVNPMRLRQVNVGCFGGGTGLPSLLGGLKHAGLI